MLDHVSDQCYFDYQRNEFMEVEYSNSICKLNLFSQNFNSLHSETEEDVKDKLKEVLLEGMRLFQLYPNLVLN